MAFVNRTIINIIDKNTIRINSNVFERSEDLKGILDRHSNQGWDEILEKLFD